MGNNDTAKNNRKKDKRWLSKSNPVTVGRVNNDTVETTHPEESEIPTTTTTITNGNGDVVRNNAANLKLILKWRHL